MADVLGEAVNWLDARRKESFSVNASYTRDGFAPIDLLATVGTVSYEVIGESGIVTNLISTDFIITAADLVFSGVRSDPMLGDRIQTVEEPGSIPRTFEVLDIAGQGHFRWSDSYGRILRVHTKLRDEVLV